MAEVNYLDFDLLIERAKENTYRARVLSSPAGQALAEITLPFSDIELENFILKVGRPRRGVRRLESPEMEAAKLFGGKLFKSVFDDELMSCLRSSLDEAKKQRKGLRIRLRLNDAPELVNLPWEYLYNPSLNRFLSLSVNTPLVRYLELPERITPLTITPPLKVLAMISSPDDYPKLDVEREWNNLKTALQDLEQRGVLVLDRLDSASPVALQYSLRRNEYHIFHFIGHGGFNQQAQDGILLFEDENRRGRPLSGQYLGTILHDEETLRLVVLNACEGARSSSSDPFAGVAQSLVQQGLPAVIAMQFEVTDDAAITFAREFYTAIAEGYPVDAAMAEARKAIFSLGNDIEWGTPVLYMRAPDGQVFDVGKVAAPEVVQPIAEIPEKDVRRAIAKEPDARLEQLYTDGLSAYWLQDWSKAWENFRQVVDIDPHYEDTAERLETVKQQLTLTTLYSDADRLSQEGNWKEALDTLKKLVELDLKYKDAAARLEAVQKQAQLADLYDQARQLHQSKHWQAVINVFVQIQALQADYPDPDGLLASAQNEATGAERQKKLQGFYRLALKAMDGSRWLEAKGLLVQVQQIQEDYNDTPRLMARAQAEIEKETSQRQRQELVLEAYQQAGDLVRSRQWQQALAVMNEVRNLDPHFVDTQGLAAAAQQGLEQEEAEVRHKEALASQYAEAVRLLGAGEAARALEVWEGLNAQSPGYPDPQNVQANASRILNTATTTVSIDLPAAKPRLPRRRLMILGGALGGIVLCVVIAGVLINRAWLGMMAALESVPTAMVTAASQPTNPPEETPLGAAATAVPILLSTLPPTEVVPPEGVLPGVETIPLDQLQPAIPWLPSDAAVFDLYTEKTWYATDIILLNPKYPPLDDPRVRQALASAVDREALVRAFYDFIGDPSPATTLVHPSILGRELYSQVGLPFDPEKARQLLAEAGYPNGEGFPEFTLPGYELVVDGLEMIAEMWRSNLGINITVSVEPDADAYYTLILADPPAIFFNEPATEIKDPGELIGMYTTDNTSFNILGFSNPQFDSLVMEARDSASQPAFRQELYIQAEQLLTEQEAIIIPLYHYTWQIKEYSIHYAEITSITIDDQGRYVVEYQTYNYTEQLPGEHVHFFFNTVPPDQAGRPSTGSWILYGGPRPFTGYRVADRPQGATQMCILVANPDHSVQPDSGNCVDLP